MLSRWLSRDDEANKLGFLTSNIREWCDFSAAAALLKNHIKIYRGEAAAQQWRRLKALLLRSFC